MHAMAEDYLRLVALIEDGPIENVPGIVFDCVESAWTLTRPTHEHVGGAENQAVGSDSAVPGSQVSYQVSFCALST